MPGLRKADQDQQPGITAILGPMQQNIFLNLTIRLNDLAIPNCPGSHGTDAVYVRAGSPETYNHNTRPKSVVNTAVLFGESLMIPKVSGEYVKFHGGNDKRTALIHW